MGKHALLSASSSRRWLSCTPSARLEEQFQDETGGSVYAEEGTAAHALAEHKLKKALKRRSKRPVSDYHCDEMEECTDGYVAFAMEQVELARQECADPVVLIEQRLDYSAYVPEGFGTGDLLIVADHILTVIDLKYGKGVAVEAERNPQMMLYGLGALELFDALYDIEIIRMTIYQPRLESVSTWEISVKDLMEWVEMELKPKAVLAMADGAVYDENGNVKHIHDRKLEALEDLIEAANGKPVLIAYWYKHDLQRIVERTGAAALDTAEDMKKWNAGEIPVAAIHPASAGHGLNLQAGGSTLVWFGLTWSLELYQQMNARLWRQGQEETVVIHHLIAKGTLDERVMAALEKKDCGQSALVDAVKARIGGGE